MNKPPVSLTIYSRSAELEFPELPGKFVRIQRCHAELLVVLFGIRTRARRASNHGWSDRAAIKREWRRTGGTAIEDATISSYMGRIKRNVKHAFGTRAPELIATDPGKGSRLTRDLDVHYENGGEVHEGSI